MRHQRAQLGAEQQGAVGDRPVERFHADAVAHQAQGAGLPVEQREGEHAGKALDGAFRPPFEEGRQHHLGVGMSAKAMAAAFQLRAQLLKIIDLAVVDDDVAAIGRVHRLRAGLAQVDDGKPPMPERDAGFRLRPGIAAVRPAMGERIDHAAGCGTKLASRAGRAKLEKPCYSAHLFGFRCEKSQPFGRRINQAAGWRRDQGSTFMV